MEEKKGDEVGREGEGEREEEKKGYGVVREEGRQLGSFVLSSKIHWWQRQVFRLVQNFE